MIDPSSSRKILHIHARDIMPYDAVGQFVHQLYAASCQNNWETYLWAENFDIASSPQVRNQDQFWEIVEPNDILFFNHSIYDPAFEHIALLENKKILYFHNVTPPDLIHSADHATRLNCSKGQKQTLLFPLFDEIFANSIFTIESIKHYFEQYGMRLEREIQVAPPLILQGDRTEPLSDRKQNYEFLYVGRLVKHKRVEKVLEVFKRICEKKPECRLTLVGACVDTGYVADLKAEASAIQAETKAQIEFLHHVSAQDLKEIYRRSNACLHMSAHEGFCIPALDSLFFDLPMFFCSQPALVEVLGSAGIPVGEDASDAADQIMSFLADAEMAGLSAMKRASRRSFWKKEMNGSKIINCIDRLHRS